MKSNKLHVITLGSSLSWIARTPIVNKKWEPAEADSGFRHPMSIDAAEVILFSHAMWPRLKRMLVGVGDVPIAGWDDVQAQRYFNRHPTLERLGIISTADSQQMNWSVLNYHI